MLYYCVWLTIVTKKQKKNYKSTRQLTEKKHIVIATNSLKQNDSKSKFDYKTKDDNINR